MSESMQSILTYWHSQDLPKMDSDKFIFLIIGQTLRRPAGPRHSSNFLSQNKNELNRKYEDTWLYYYYYRIFPLFSTDRVTRYRFFHKVRSSSSRAQSNLRGWSGVNDWVQGFFLSFSPSIDLSTLSTQQRLRSTWKYQFSYLNLIQATLSLVSTRMEDFRSSVAWVLPLTLKVG